MEPYAGARYCALSVEIFTPPLVQMERQSSLNNREVIGDGALVLVKSVEFSLVTNTADDTF